MTGSGKTTLAKLLVKRYKLANRPSIVLDPMRDPNWQAEFQTHDTAEFLKTMYESEGCALFVDESGKSIGKYGHEMSVVTTESRHFGHKAILISQRAQQIDKNVRDQCSELYIFRVGHDDAKTLAAEFGYPELKRASELKRGEFYKLDRFNPPQLFNIFDSAENK